MTVREAISAVFSSVTFPVMSRTSISSADSFDTNPVTPPPSFFTTMVVANPWEIEALGFKMDSAICSAFKIDPT